MSDRWLVLVVLQFVSGAIGFIWGLLTNTLLFLYIGGFFFSLGVFAATKWGHERWKAKDKSRNRRRR